MATWYRGYNFAPVEVVRESDKSIWVKEEGFGGEPRLRMVRKNSTYDLYFRTKKEAILHRHQVLCRANEFRKKQADRALQELRDFEATFLKEAV